MSDSPQSPPKEVEQGVQSPDEEAQMNDPQDPQASGLAYEFEVKEQDRWLPIANGASDSPFCFIVIREGVRCFVHLWFALHGYWLSLQVACSCSASKKAPRISIRPCPTNRPQSRRMRLALHPRPTNMISTMLTFATLRQSLGS